MRQGWRCACASAATCRWVPCDRAAAAWATAECEASVVVAVAVAVAAAVELAEIGVAWDRLGHVGGLAGPPGAGGAALGAGGEVVLPEDDARGLGMQRRWRAEERLHGGRVAAQACYQRRDVFRRAATVAEAVE